MAAFKSYFFILLGALLCFTACENSESTSDTSAPSKQRLGTIDLTITGKPEALPLFERGLLLLHSFEYADSREAFQEAQKEDPDLAMAYWGEAMTHNHNLWREQDFEDGRRALNKLAESPEERLAKCPTAFEKDLMQAADILYGTGKKNERDQAYADFMEQLSKKYPENHEVASLYALSVLGAVPVGRDEEAYGKAAAIAQGILQENPNHPGALHYLIHSYDDPGHAAMALEAANSYSVVAPDASHALHMPSHIYVALGMWDEVVSSNIASWNASIKRMNRKELDNDARSYHAWHWLMYGYLQQNRPVAAKEVLDRMIAFCEELPSRTARSYVIRMSGNYLAETGSWETLVPEMLPDTTEDLNIAIRSVANFIEGRGAAANSDWQGLAAIIKRIEADRTNAALIVDEKGLPMCGSAGAKRSAPNELDLQHSRVMELQLSAILADAQGNKETAEQYLKEATQLQESLSYSYGPPEIIVPTWEGYGQWLLEQKRPEEAFAQFQYALARGPRRHKALSGQLAAARLLGNEDQITEIIHLLEEIEREEANNLEILSLR